MGKKNKKERKGKGKEKTEIRSEKKAEKRTKKDLAEKGEEDITKLIAQFQEQDRRKEQVIEEKCPPPSPRCNATLVAHPDREELLLFGGEYYTGKKMFVYNDLFAYQIKRNEWMNISVPNAPPPRSAHQAVVVSHQGGQMWIFGGEFSSHTQSQFYHYKDLWLLHLRDKKWEQIKAPGGPTARSGHRMVAVKKQIFVFGGFHDNNRDFKYFNDMYSFDLETYTWTLLTPLGTGPSPRSGCVLVPVPDVGKIVVYGGYSKEKLKKDVDKGITHTDMFALVQEKKREGTTDSSSKWKWQSVKQGGARPSARSGMAAALAAGNRIFLFGGVFDEEEDEEDLEGIFFNELLSLDLDNWKWSSVQLRGKRSIVSDKKKRRKKKINNEGGDDSVKDEEEECDEEDEMDMIQEAVENVLEIESSGAEAAPTSADEGVFTVRIAQPTAGSESAEIGNSAMEVDQFWPSKRMNTALANQAAGLMAILISCPSYTVKDGVLFMYGGIYEEGDKQITLNDFYSLDIHKSNEWSVLIAENRKLQVWQDSDSSEDEEDKNAEKGATAVVKTDQNEEDGEDEDSDESMEITFDDAPNRRDGEGILDYYSRSQDYWLQKAKEIYEEDGDEISERRLLRFAKEICEEACDK